MSFRMSKDLANSIASTVMRKRSNAIDKLKLAITKRLTEEYEKQLPLSIRKAFKLFPGYFRTTNSISVFGAGMGAKNYQSISKYLPEHNSERGVKLDPQTAQEIGGMYSQLEDMKKDYAERRSEIQNALITLNSFSRIQKELPEVVKYLPKSSSQALMINLDKTKEIIRTA